jgi:GNAT superfamily N-acetyltransferase
MTDEEAIAYLRHRRANHFYPDVGPELPPGASARWRLTPDDPRGWHANMIGYVEAPSPLLPQVLDRAISWFSSFGVDTWLDVDEFGALFQRQEIIAARAFVLHDDWDAMICRSLKPLPQAEGIDVHLVREESGLRIAAEIAEQEDAQGLPDPYALQRRLRRLRHEYVRGWSIVVIGTLDGVPVGTARLTVERLPVVVGVVTKPAARGRGVATAITSVLVKRALADHGQCALYVDRGSQADRIYRRLGFEPLFRCRIWHRQHAGRA